MPDPGRGGDGRKADPPGVGSDRALVVPAVLAGLYRQCARSAYRLGRDRRSWPRIRPFLRCRPSGACRPGGMAVLSAGPGRPDRWPAHFLFGGPLLGLFAGGPVVRRCPGDRTAGLARYPLCRHELHSDRLRPRFRAADPASQADATHIGARSCLCTVCRPVGCRTVAGADRVVAASHLIATRSRTVIRTTMRKDMSNTSFSRRQMLAASGGALIGAHPALAATSNVSGMPQEGPDTPKLTMYISADPTESEMKKIKQIGINIVDMPDMPPPPWTEDWFRKRMDLLATQGLKLGIVMVPWFRDGVMWPEMLKVVHGKPGRDDLINKLKASIVAAGKVGLPV